MRIKLFFAVLYTLFTGITGHTQSLSHDTVEILSEVTVKGFETNRHLIETPASVNIINQKNIQRFVHGSFVPVMNTVPGIRMEERSPGSYRLSIRGSLLRSPFGIRNIKIYIGDMPFTDAGGNSYINLIDPSAFGNVEILKGLAGSLYGAGTGGVVILNTPVLNNLPAGKNATNQLKGTFQAGSYGLFSENVNWQVHKEKYGMQLTQSHLQCEGYRDNSRLRKDVVHFSNNRAISPKDELRFQLLLADLYYQTPGGLTLSQWQADPKQSRPATATLPGAKQQKAAVYNKTVFAGINNKIKLPGKFSNSSSFFISYTDFKNPFITNYEKRKETSRGFRTAMEFAAVDNKNIALHFLAGGELQSTFANIDNYENKSGQPDSVQSRDEVNAFQRFYFMQADVSINRKWFINTGASINQFTYRYTRTSGVPVTPEKTKSFNAEISPRLSVLYKATDIFSVRAIISKGFSAPTIAEVRPSEGNFYDALQAEYGWNFEAGIRSSLFNNRLYVDINAYTFNLRNAIVRRTAGNGAEYFINAGGTKQRGLEALFVCLLIDNNKQLVSQLKITSSLSLNNYRFKNYSINESDLSGNAITGVPGKTIAATMDVELKNSLCLCATYNYTSSIPLTDANDIYANGYHLVQCKLGYRLTLKRLSLNVFAGADNLLNSHYSLGNDLNAAGGRFYNPAPARNYCSGIIIGFK